jgi:molecular chaperone Hsp33
MDRVERSLTMLGRDELSHMVAEAKDVNIRCEFCGRTYKISLDRLRELLAEFASMN